MSTEETRARVPLREVLAGLAGASRGFWLVNLVNFGDGIAYFGFLSLLTLFFEHDVGMSTRASTIATSTFTGLVTLFMVLGAGALSDRLGARRALGVSMAIVLVGRVVLTMAPGLGSGSAGAISMVWIAILLMGFAEGAVQPALYAGVKEYTDARTASMGYAFLYSIMNLGIFLGEMASPLVREQFARRFEGVEVSLVPTAGITGSFWFFAGITALVLVMHLALFTKKVEARDRVASSEVIAAPAAGAPSTVLDRVRALPIMDTRFLFFIFALLPVRTLFAHQWLTLPGYVTRAFPAEIGARLEWIQGINPLIIVFAVPALAALTRKLRVIDVMIAGTLVSAAATFLLGAGPNLTMLLAYVVIFTIGEAVWASRFLEYVSDLAPPGRLGVYMGLAGLPWFLAKTVTGFYAGEMLDVFVPVEGTGAPGMLWIIHGMIAMISPIALLAGRRWLLAKEAR
ncbi:MAG: MFS transporter [Myxococcota bacterium]|nr:MFS transporter [Myxococcota bacterium]